jgi:hypothetical protein
MMRFRDTFFRNELGFIARGIIKGECFDVQLKMKKERLETLQKGTGTITALLLVYSTCTGIFENFLIFSKLPK